MNIGGTCSVQTCTKNYTLIKPHEHWWHMFCTNVYQNYTLIKPHEHWWHMFCEYVYLTTKPEGVNLENDEITKYGLC